MSLRKEQVLALLVLVLGAYLYTTYGEIGGGRNLFNARFREVEVEKVPVLPLVEGDPDLSGRRTLFTQPRETLPLPPRELDFPPQSAASIVALPLPIGPDYRNFVRLAMDGSVVEGVQVQESTPEAAATGEGEDGGQGGPPDIEQLRAQAAKTYARIWAGGLSNPFYGILVAVKDSDGKVIDKFDAEKLKDLSDYTVELRMYDVRDGKLGKVREFRQGTQQVDRIALADNIKNTIIRRQRAIPEDAAHLDERGTLIVDLLEWAKIDITVYEIALAEAKRYTKISGGALDGYRWEQRVLQAKGDLAAEFELLEKRIDARHRETAFRYEGLGRLQARIGLLLDAEQNLRQAAQLGPQDARPHAALAEFLLKQGRSREAAPIAAAAERTFGSLLQATDKARVARVLVASALAVGDVEGAKRARSLVSASIVPRSLDGCIAYAEGDVEGALGMFESAAGQSALGAMVQNEARLGAAACLVRLGRWQEAADALVYVYAEAPLLRHRAAGGMSLLYQKLGDYEAALTWVDRAIEADPTDAYAYYLRGRAQRLLGQLAQAQESFTAALTRHDDFVHVIAEVAKLHGEQAAIELGEDAGRLVVSSLRYSDRAVALSPIERSELFELQGRRHFAASDRREAKAAFLRARESATVDADRLFARGAVAVVDYALGRSDDAVAVLLRLSEDLPKEDQVKVWADETVQAIDDHAQKELLADSFERDDLGDIWQVERDGGLGPKAASGKLVFRGKAPTSGQGEVWAARASAIRNGKNFLAVKVKMKVGASHQKSSFTGLRIQAQQGGNGRNRFQVDLGVRDHEPYLFIRDSQREEPVRAKNDVLGVANFTLDGEHELEIRVLPQGAQAGNVFVLQVSWDGQVIHQRELKSLSGTTQTELKTVLFVQDARGGQVDVEFDDYVLERKKER
ncbi:MAG: tetratricopeptide repeat protein [bacterium]|nr:tetratricopeptide repeat protein [bacterium]